MINMKKMSQWGAVSTIEEICDGLKKFTHENPKTAKDILFMLISDVLEPYASIDGFGTEGWEVGLSVS